MIGLLAAVGAFFLFVLFIRSSELFYVDEISRQTPSPTKSLIAYQKVTRGGFGTVWTTQLFIRPANEQDGVSIYSNGDSDFEPPFRWDGPETLRVFIPCGRISHLGNPADYADGDEPIDRVKVRFTYIDPGCGPGAPHSEEEE